MGKSAIQQQIEGKFQEIGGFTWEQAETWAGFCSAVGMEPLPYLKVMLNNICDVKSTTEKSEVPSKVSYPELWVISRGFRTRLELVEPD